MVPLEDAGLSIIQKFRSGADLGVIGRTQQVADVLHQRADHIFLVLADLADLAVLEGSRFDLQRVFQPVHGIATAVAGQHL